MASLALSTTAKAERALALATMIDAADEAATLTLYTDDQPATPDDPIDTATLLVEIVCPYPFALSVEDGVLTANPFSAVMASASGIVTWGRLQRSDGVVIGDFTVGNTGSGANIEMQSTQVFSGSTQSITSFVITEA